MAVLSLMSWNMNQRVSNWEAVLTAGVDAALLQEAKPPPSHLCEKIAVDVEGDWLATDLPWRAVVAGLSDRIVITPIMAQPLGGGNPTRSAVYKQFCTKFCGNSCRVKGLTYLLNRLSSITKRAVSPGTYLTSLFAKDAR